MRPAESCECFLVATSRCPGLVGSSGTWSLRRGLRRQSHFGSGSGKCSVATCGLGGGALGMVSEGGWTGGRGMALLGTPLRGTKICLRGSGQASRGARALPLLCCRTGSLAPNGHRYGAPLTQAPRERAAAHARRRRHYARPHSARRRAQAARVLPGCGDPCIRAFAHARPGGVAPSGSRSLRRRGTVDFRRCAKASLGFLCGRQGSALQGSALTLDDTGAERIGEVLVDLG
jgi:hypothetical protein